MENKRERGFGMKFKWQTIYIILGVFYGILSISDALTGKDGSIHLIVGLVFLILAGQEEKAKK